jgi:hypothetical protein
LLDWKCERKCESIPTLARNLLVIAGDRIVTAHCRRGVDTRYQAIKSSNNLILKSCLEIVSGICMLMLVFAIIQAVCSLYDEVFLKL